MQRPDIDKYEAMAGKATPGPWVSPWEMVPKSGNPEDYWFQGPNCTLVCGATCIDGHVLYVKREDAALMAASRVGFPELCAYVRALESLIRDWLAACPETCGQCEHVHKAAEEVVR